MNTDCNPDSVRELHEQCAVYAQAIMKRDRALHEIIARIEAFEQLTRENEYTDTGEAWDHFHALRDIARQAIKGSRVPFTRK